MIVTYALDPQPKSIFLAGPTPRSPEILSWRPQAIAILEGLGFDGEVIVPEACDWQPHDDYGDQIAWEWAGIDRATVVAFWIPRCLVTMPAFTTNIEFGLVAASGKAVLGAPHDAPEINYLLALADRYLVPTTSSLRSTMRIAVAHAHR